MISIRLSKVGRKNGASYRIVVTNKRSGRNGRALEILGYFNPKQKEVFKINAERLKHWLGVGAKATLAVEKLLAKPKA